MTNFAAGFSGLSNLFGNVARSTNNLLSPIQDYRKSLQDKQWQIEEYNRYRKDSLDDYARVRGDALSDYEMMNKYNSPGETMKRLKSAGLNPHLVYGNGAVTTAAPVKSSDVHASSMRSWNPAVARTQQEPLPLVNDYMDMEIKSAQLDLIRKNTDVAKMDALLKAVNIDLKKFDRDFKSQFRSSLGEQLIESVRGMFLKNQGQVVDNAYKYQTQDARISATRSSARIKEIEAGLMEMGLTPRDPLFDRYLSLAMNDPDLDWKDIAKLVINALGGGKVPFKLPKLPKSPVNKSKGEFKYWDPKFIK